MTALSAQDAGRTLAAWTLASGTLPQAQSAAWLKTLKSAARRVLEAEGLPVASDDAWRHMGVEALLKDTWSRTADASLLEAAAGTSGVEIRSWDDLGREPEPLAARRASGPLVNFNSVYLDRAFSIRAAKNVCSLQPVRLTPAPAPGAAPGWMIHPRASILLEAGSRLDIILDLSRLPDIRGLLNLVLDIELRDQTALNLVVAGADAEQVMSLLDVSVVQHRDSVFRFFTLETRARQSRLEMAVSMEGENASADLFGLALLSGVSRAFHHVKVDHRVPRTQSQQIFKSVLSGEARYEYDSLVTIHPEAPHGSSEQLNKNLLLSDSARAYARPQLAIHTDEVQCHHGATVGQMSVEELLYLRTRGLDEATASALILRGFVNDLLKEIPVSAAAADLQRRANARLETAGR